MLTTDNTAVLVVHASAVIRKEILMDNEWVITEKQGSTHFPNFPPVHNEI
jgi:hypothetical protein